MCGSYGAALRSVCPMTLMRMVIGNCTPTDGAYSAVVQVCKRAYNQDLHLNVCQPCQQLKSRYAKKLASELSKDIKLSKAAPSKTQKRRRINSDGMTLVPIDELKRFLMDPSNQKPDARIMRRIVKEWGRVYTSKGKHPYFAEKSGPIFTYMLAAHNALVEVTREHKNPKKEFVNKCINEAIHTAWVAYNEFPVIHTSLAAAKLTRAHYHTSAIVPPPRGVSSPVGTWSNCVQTLKAALDSVPADSVLHYKYEFANA
jgi:hypothetical protein